MMFRSQRLGRPRTPLLAAWLVGATVLTHVADVTAGDWAHWRGPEQNGISREKNLPETFTLAGGKREEVDGRITFTMPETGTNVEWVSYIGGRATPIVLNDKVYLNCKTWQNAAAPRQKLDARQQVVCWDAKTGEVLWKDVFNVAQSDIPHPRVGWAAPVGDPETGNVYVHTVDSQLKCYSGDGKLLWNHDMTAEYGTVTGYGGRTQTPIIDEDRLIVSFLAVNWGDTKGPAPKHFYYAFDKNDGKLLWVSAPGGKPEDTNYSCPIVTVVDGQRLLIGGNADGGVYAMQARTGKPVWGFRMSRRGLNASVVVDGGTVFATHGEDNLNTNAFGRVTAIDGTMTGDLTPDAVVPGKNKGQIWRVDNLKAGYASPLVKDGILYVVDDGGNLNAYDSETGKFLWFYDAGTVGKGSPVWADGKIYLMEVSGNVHIVKPTREGCEQLCRVELPAVDPSAGTDEIYASPAVSNGRVFLCTRDRMICLKVPDAEVESDPVPPLPEEKAAEKDAALAQLVPYEVTLKKGETVDYEVRTFDANGRMLASVAAAPEIVDGLEGVAFEGATLKTDGIEKAVAGKFVAKVGDLEATGRARVFPPLPWSWDFAEFKGIAVPPTWVRGHIKVKPAVLEDEPVMKNTEPPSRPSIYIWLGPTDMKDYVIQADFRFEGKRKLSYAGITNQRYNFIAKANTNKLQIQSWAPHLRMAETKSMRFKDGIWYTMKFQVDVANGAAVCKGKIWEREKAEPDDWSLVAEDPHANEAGSPGLYFYSLSDTYVDNVSVKGK